MSCLCFLHAGEMKSKIFSMSFPQHIWKNRFICMHPPRRKYSKDCPSCLKALGWAGSWLDLQYKLFLVDKYNAFKGKSLQHNFPFKNIISLLRKKKHHKSRVKTDYIPNVFVGSTKVWGSWSLPRQFVNVLVLLCLQGIVRKQVQFDDRCTVILLLQGTGWGEKPSIHNDPFPVQVHISGGLLFVSAEGPVSNA